MDIFGIISGLLLIGAGAFTSGSFAIPFGKIKDWKWESYWLIYSVGAYIIFPVLACILFAPGFTHIYGDTDRKVIVSIFLSGMIYGVGNLSFGLSLRYLGISLGYALSLGLMLAIGTLVPPAIDGRLAEMFRGMGGILLITGVLVSCIGIAFSARAGVLRDRVIPESEKQNSVKELNMAKGLLAALLVGITGSFMSLGIEQGIPLAENARLAGVSPLFVTLPVMLLLLSGTMVTTLFYCIWLGTRNKSLGDYSKTRPASRLSLNYFFALSASVLWFSQFILFGMGKSRMGKFNFTSWGILMALTIAFATVWGLYRGEWKGATRKIYILLAVSLIIIIGASFLIGISGSL